MHTHAVVLHAPKAKLNHIVHSGSLEECTRMMTKLSRNSTSLYRDVLPLAIAHQMLALNDVPLDDVSKYDHLCLTRDRSPMYR